MLNGRSCNTVPYALHEALSTQYQPVTYREMDLLYIQDVYKFNQAGGFQEIPGGLLRKIQDMFALLRPPM